MTAAAARLRQQVALATEIGNEDSFEAKQRIDASHQARYRLEDMAPELALLAADMADALQREAYYIDSTDDWQEERLALLARLDTLTEAGG